MGKIAVIGGGAAGMMAAITAARLGAEVTIYERNDRVGKKILSTGNGKCNFSNRDFSVEYYYGDKERLEKYFHQFSVEDAVDFFTGAGMLVRDKGGYLYPWSEQASTVLDVLRLEVERSGGKVEIWTEVKGITQNGGGRFTILTLEGEKKKTYDAVVLACGGCAAPKTGSDGSGFVLAKSLGHHVKPTVPALVQLRCKDSFLKAVAGVRCQARLALYSGKKGEKPIQEEEGELQFTDYGISGIPVFQFSRQAAYLLQNGENALVSIDLLPQFDGPAFERLCAKRAEGVGNKTLEEFLLGVANKKVNLMMIKEEGYKPGEMAKKLGTERLNKLLYSYKKLWVHITAVNSFDCAQATAGGIDMNEVTDELESVKMPGVFLAGEMLDVDGRCGGYNLQWAWTSGYIAGRGAAQRIFDRA